MADEIDALFMFGDDLEAILDVLEEDGRIQDDFTAAVNHFLSDLQASST